jgi:Fur family zinc uptake transcriptional regulator
MNAVFPEPGHNHDRCAADVLAHADRVCAERAQRLTPMRRRVLEVLAESHQPLGAYEIMDRVNGAARPAPITVYRALDFLIANGLVHRIESRNAFIACGHNHASGALVAFLICESCGAVGELPAAAVGESVAAAARAAGFAAKLSVVEIAGTCAHCRAGAAASA